MFTGIVEEVGRVERMGRSVLVIDARTVLEGTKVGDSINVNGACLTVSSLGVHSFSVDLMPETIRRTTLGSLSSGKQVNLERALGLGRRLGGHFVQGHVDTIGRVLAIAREGEARVIKIWSPADVMRYMVEKGFVAVDGVSLTVVRLESSSFDVSLVTHTLLHTVLGLKKPGDTVNLEADVLGKYVERMVGAERRGLTLDFLEQYGYTKAGDMS